MQDEKPIIFCGDMVRAILDGRKTMTRRIDGLDEIIEDRKVLWTKTRTLVEKKEWVEQ